MTALFSIRSALGLDVEIPPDGGDLFVLAHDVSQKALTEACEHDARAPRQLLAQLLAPDRTWQCVDPVHRIWATRLPGQRRSNVVALSTLAPDTPVTVERTTVPGRIAARVRSAKPGLQTFDELHVALNDDGVLVKAAFGGFSGLSVKRARRPPATPVQTTAGKALELGFERAQAG